MLLHEDVDMYLQRPRYASSTQGNSPESSLSFVSVFLSFEACSAGRVSFGRVLAATNSSQASCINPTFVHWQLRVPTRLIHGGKDDIAYPKGSEQMMDLLKSCPDKELKVR